MDMSPGVQGMPMRSRFPKDFKGPMGHASFKTSPSQTVFTVCNVIAELSIH